MSQLVTHGMFFWSCCGPRQRRSKGPIAEPEHVPPAETDWLLGGDPPAQYADDSTDKPSRHEVDFLRNIVREAESKMVNVTHDEPFQFHATPYSEHGNDSTLDASSDSPSHGSDHSYEEGYEHSPDSGSRRGRHNSRQRLQRTSPLIQTISQHHGPRGGLRDSGVHGVRKGSGSGSSDTRRPGHRSPSPNAGTPRGSRRGGRVSPSPSLDGGDSLHSGYSNYSYDPADDSYYRDGYGYDDEDAIDPDEEAHIRRLRGPKLNVRILPLPAREAEIAEEEERIRQEEEAFAADGDITPVQERVSMALTPKPQLPERVSAQPLSSEDQDAIVALSDALWKALEDGLRIREPPKVIHRWDD